MLRKALRVTVGMSEPSVRNPWTRRVPVAIPELVSFSAIASAKLLLHWYDRHRRRLPWRTADRKPPDTYRVWLSEIMLQQTTVTAVIPYFERFVTRFPTVEALAAASLDEVLSVWAGLGYYARARNLHACARAVVAAGGFPADPVGLRALPGIGAYTAVAIAAIAFDTPGVPVDGNVERVVARLFGVTDPLPVAKSTLKALASQLGADPDAIARPGDFAQALFDLGATTCTPASPACGLCPWNAACVGRRSGMAAELPRRTAKPDRPRRYGVHFWLTDRAGNVLLRRRPEHGLLGGMLELPGSEWRSRPWPLAEAATFAPVQAPWREAGEVRHGFTHFILRIDLVCASVDKIPPGDLLVPLARLHEAALPSVMRKCVALMTSGHAPPHHATAAGRLV